MQHIDKIIKFHNLLKRRRTPISGKELDKQLGSSKSTRQRLTKELPDHLNAPLICNRSAGGYYYDRTDLRYPFELPGIWLTADELQALIACQHLLGNLAPGLLRNEIGQLRDHLQKLLDRSPGIKTQKLSRVKILSHAYRCRDGDLFLTLAQALFEQQRLLVHYHARSDDQTSARTISPQNLVLYKDNWYLDAYCHQLDEPRTFALDRIRSATASGEPALLLEPDTLQQHFAPPTASSPAPPKHTAILNFSAKAGRWVADETWHSRQESEWLTDGRYQLRIPFNRHEELLMDILKYGAEVEVVEPGFLRELVKAAAEKMLAMYRSNIRADRASLVNKLIKLPGIKVCLEATGIYHFDLAIALHDAGIPVMVVNPKASHNFAKALMKNSKTDAVDANTLAEYVERMDFVAWTRPSNQTLVLRGFARRIDALTSQKAAAKNHLHALSATEETPQALLRDAKLAISQLEKRIDTLADEAMALIDQHPELQRIFELLTGIKGIAQTSAIALMGELLLLPPNLSHREWVKFAGLDPKAFESGKSVHKKMRLSKAGNRHIRSALYMPALSAKQHDPHVRAYFQHLLDNGKKPLQAVCAVMRKLLHAIHGMLKHDQPFDNTRFYAIPVPNVAQLRNDEIC